MKVLMLVPWEVQSVEKDDLSKQSANLSVSGQRYWFFRYCGNNEMKIDVLGMKNASLIDYLERRLLRFHVFYPFRALCRVSGYDAVACFHSQVGIVLAFFMSLFGGRPKSFILFDVEGLGRKHSWWQRILIKKALSSISSVVYFASVQKEDYLKYFPAVMDKAQFVHFGVDPVRYMPHETTGEDYIISLGYQGASFRDWKTLIRAYGSIRTDTRLLIVGKNGFGFRDIGRENIPVNIEFMGEVDLKRLNELVSRARFVVLPLPERRHAFAQMTLLGCMALGKAVIVSKVSGIIDYVEDGDNALFVEPYSSEDMKRKMESLLSNPERAALLGRRARLAVESRFNEKKMAKFICNAMMKQPL